ncbi:hypothetical protein Q1695_011366 [Nippostrongylus brasiliensis]|nr:hypothetical protein Q1695_011366 [Nippostrongylus brasiliensis]
MQIHNKHRSDLALGKVKNKMGNYFPTSIREYEMALSLELEKKALEYARDWEHDNTGWKKGPWHYYCNDTWVSSTVINNAADDVDALEKAIKIWWKDRKLVDDEDMKVMFNENCYRNEATRRFVMIARGYNSLMGCAVDKKKNQHNVVCVYETSCSAESVAFYQPLYEMGEPCGATTCFNQASSRFCSRGLCASYAEASVRVFSNEIDDNLL